MSKVIINVLERIKKKIKTEKRRQLIVGNVT